MILITGGAGFIGSRLAQRLLAEKQPIIIIDNFNDYYDPQIKRANIAALQGEVQVVEGDIRNRDLLERLFNENKITKVVHLAAMAGVRYSKEMGPLYADVNTNASVSLMDLARLHDVELFIQASTSSVYGNSTRIPFSEEDTPDFPLAPYPASKRATEIFAHSYHHLFGLNITVLRFFNVYGPHGRPDMMPLLTIDAILQGKTISLFGGGTPRRDWTYVDDTVDGIMAALNRPMGYEIINLGYGDSIALNDFIEIYESLIGKKAITESIPTPLTEPEVLYCDNTRARELLGFSPQVPIAEGLARTWAWYREKHGL